MADCCVRGFIITCLIGMLKDPSQPPPFSMPLKLLLHGEAKSYCFTVSCVPECVFNHLK